jgi:hypothetical protein
VFPLFLLISRTVSGVQEKAFVDSWGFHGVGPNPKPLRLWYGFFHEGYHRGCLGVGGLPDSGWL